jgi:hypothetical protein
MEHVMAANDRGLKLRFIRYLHRFVVTGINAAGLLVEYITDDLELAVQWYDWLDCSDYKTRMYDNEERRFIGPEVVGHMLRFYS